MSWYPQWSLWNIVCSPLELWACWSTPPWWPWCWRRWWWPCWSCQMCWSRRCTDHRLAHTCVLQYLCHISQEELGKQSQESKNYQDWCSPFPQGLDTAKVSVWHSPRLFPVPAAAVVGPMVMVVTVTGLLNTKLSKSSLKFSSFKEIQVLSQLTLFDTQRMNSEILN